MCLAFGKDGATLARGLDADVTERPTRSVGDSHQELAMSEADRNPLALTPIDAPSGGSALKRIVIWGLVLLVVIVLLAELGVVRLESTQTKWNAKSQYDTHWV